MSEMMVTRLGAGIDFLEVDLPSKQTKRSKKNIFFFDYTPQYDHHLVPVNGPYLRK